MNRSASIRTGLCLSALEIAALSEGRTIAAISRMFIRPGQQFALYPHDAAAMPLLSSSHQLTIVSTQPSQLSVETITLESWAQCELCQILDASSPLQRLAELTQYPLVELQEIVHQRNHLFLVYLRVYGFPHEIVLSANLANSDKVGKFVVLPTGQVASDLYPVVSDRAFAQRKHQLENLEPPEHPELEELHRAIASLAITNPNAKAFVHEIESFLGWADNAITHQSDLDWINTIAAVGNSSNGDLFEKLVRRSLLKLGFTNSNLNPQTSLDPNGCGGAGGLDFYCEQPYPVVGECKATKTDLVPDGTPAQLVKLGYRHLQEQFNGCIKIILAAGQLNGHAKQTATGNRMNVLRPETLQRLVELKAKHPGAVNLLELKPCLEQAPFGEEADDKVNRYVDQAWQQIKIRAYIVRTLKKYLDDKKLDDVEFKRFYGVYDASNATTSLSEDDMYEILKELSSPLTGYLGRKKGSDGSARFYFLRSLDVDS